MHEYDVEDHLRVGIVSVAEVEGEAGAFVHTCVALQLDILEQVRRLLLSFINVHGLLLL